MAESAREVVGTANAMSRALGCPEEVLRPVSESSGD